MKRELIIGIILAVVCGLSVKDVLDAIRCRKREEEIGRASCRERVYVLV